MPTLPVLLCSGLALSLLGFAPPRESLRNVLELGLAFLASVARWAGVEAPVAEGLEITREPTPIPELGDAVVGLAKDPDGYVIELLQR